MKTATCTCEPALCETRWHTDGQPCCPVCVHADKARLSPDEIREELSESLSDPVTKAARDLSAIEDLWVHLTSQAIHLAGDRLMPGGRAMVAMGPEADLNEWSEQLGYLELQHIARCEKGRWDWVVTEVDEAEKPVSWVHTFAHKHCTYAEHLADGDDQDSEPPLQTLLFWSEAWREERGYPLEGRRPTLVSEASFIRNSLEWAWENELHFEDFARDVRRTRLHLENLLYHGRRLQRVRVRCIEVTCERKPRLIKVYGRTAAFDHYKCTSCKRRYNPQEYLRAFHDQLDSQGADRFIWIQDAIGVLERDERVIRQWIADGKVQTERKAGRVLVWWPDLRRLHQETPRRKRRGA